MWSYVRNMVLSFFFCGAGPLQGVSLGQDDRNSDPYKVQAPSACKGSELGWRGRGGARLRLGVLKGD